MVTPSRTRNDELQRAGLGRIKIRINANANTQALKEALENAFLKLLWGGGFELLN